MGDEDDAIGPSYGGDKLDSIAYSITSTMDEFELYHTQREYMKTIALVFIEYLQESGYTVVPYETQAPEPAELIQWDDDGGGVPPTPTDAHK